MENKENRKSNINKSVRYHCVECKSYITSEKYVSSHSDHNVVDLAVNSTDLLAKYQSLARMASLLADRRQLYIKDESIDRIMDDIKKQLLNAKNSLQTDIGKSVDEAAGNLLNNPLIQEMSRVKTELSGKDDQELTKVKNELNRFCKDLLEKITECQFENADKLINSMKLEEHKATIERLSEKAEGDIDFIHEIRKLMKTKVDYSYNPLEALGMIKVQSNITKPPRIIQFDRENNLIHTFNCKTGKVEKAKLTAGFILPFRFVLIETGNNVYLNGGDNDHGVYLKSHYLYDELRSTLITLNDMNQVRSRHALTNVKDKVYAIGGENEYGILNHCEYYDIKENKWIVVGQLHGARCNLSACSLDNSIYVIGGWNKSYLNTIEELDVSSNKWEIVKIKEKSLKPIQVAGVVGIIGNEILIFGGYQEGELLTSDCYSFHTKDGKLTKKGDMKVAEAFIASEVKNIDNIVYAFGYTAGGIHSYNTTSDSWQFIPQSDIDK